MEFLLGDNGGKAGERRADFAFLEDLVKPSDQIIEKMGFRLGLYAGM